MSDIRISITELEQLCVTALQTKGATENEAKIVFSDYLEAELRRRLSHGFASFKVAMDAYPAPGKFQIEKSEGALISVEGNGDCGHIVARAAIDHALERRSESGVFVIGIRNISRFNTPAPIARYASDAGLVAIVTEYGGMNFMIPHGGTTAALSTNPLAIAIPGTDFLLDMATSERAIGYVTLAKAKNEPIPSSWAVDEHGEPTTDPTRVAAMIPFGGYKGYGLALALEILSGALVGVPIGSLGKLSCRGALIVLIDPTAFGHTKDSFTEQVRTFLSEVGSVRPVNSDLPVTFPGQRGGHEYMHALERGTVDISQSFVEELKGYA